MRLRATVSPALPAAPDFLTAPVPAPVTAPVPAHDRGQGRVRASDAPRWRLDPEACPRSSGG